MVMKLKIELLMKQIREEKNISLRELSKRTKISDSHLSSIERQEKEPGFYKMVAIAQSLGVTTEDLYRIKN